MTSGGDNLGDRGSASSAPSPMAGRVIGDFRIVREVGRGGMAVVYEARQLSLDRIVALKVLSRPPGPAGATVERFRREARAAAKLHHPHIVPIYAYDEAEGAYYYAMELVRGRTVHQIIWAQRGLQEHREQGGAMDLDAGDAEETVLLSPGPAAPEAQGGGPSDSRAAVAPGASRRTPRDFDAIARHIATVADALAYAHGQGVIHRDIKPHNLILSTDGRICVSDFGLARVTGQPGMTVTSEFIGSPLYMSPEQILSGHLRVDHRTDIYSLGATLYEWLTLAPPFPGETREAVISRIVNSEVPPLRSHDPRIPVDIETICLKAIEKDPNRRYPTAAEMRDDLNRYLQGAAIRAQRAGPLTRLRKAVARNRVAAVIAAAAVIAVASGSLVYRQWRSSRVEVAQHHAKVQEQGEQIAAAEERKSQLEIEKTRLEHERDAILKGLTEQLYRLGKPVLAGENPDEQMLYSIAAKFASAMLSDLRRAERERLEAAPSSSDTLDASEEYYLGAIVSDNVAVALAMVNQSLNVAPGHFSARLLRAVFACSVRNFQEMLTDAEALVVARPGAHEGYFIRGAARLFSGRAADAVGDLRRAIDRGGNSAWLFALSGLAQYQQRYYASAEADFRRALAVDPAHTAALMGRARCYSRVRNYHAAIADATHAIELNPTMADAYILRAECLDELERYDESIADYLKANTLSEGSLAILGKLALAQANKQRQEQAARAAAGGSSSAPAPSVLDGATLPDDEGQRDSLRRLLDQLRGEGPSRPPPDAPPTRTG